MTERQLTVADVPHLARHLLEQHGLWASGWRFAWDHARRRAGCCKYGKKLVTVSRHYAELNVANNPGDVVDTLLHEVAHALTPGHHHDDVWKAKCVEVGARPQRCFDVADVEMPEGRYAATCGGCGREYHRHKAERAGTWRYCRKCGKDVGRLTFVDRAATASERPQQKDVPPPPKKVR